MKAGQPLASVILVVLLLLASTTANAFFCFSMGSKSRASVGGYQGYQPGFYPPPAFPAVYYPHYDPATHDSLELIEVKAPAQAPVQPAVYYPRYSPVSHDALDVIDVNAPAQLPAHPGRLADELHPWERL